MLELAPEIEKTVREHARHAGLTENDYIARLLRSAGGPQPKDVLPLPVPNTAVWKIPTNTTDDAKRAKVLEYIGLSKEEAIIRNAPSIAWLDAKLAEAKNATAEEIAEADAEWEAHKQAMNENRRLSGEPLLYPELSEPKVKDAP